MVCATIKECNKVDNAETEKDNTMNGKAAASLILGIISIIFIPIISDIGLVLSVIGLILGFISLHELKSVHQVGKMKQY